MIIWVEPQPGGLEKKSRARVWERKVSDPAVSATVVNSWQNHKKSIDKESEDNTVELIVENPSVAIWQYNRPVNEPGTIWQGEKLSKAEREKMIETLTKLCESQRKQ